MMKEATTTVNIKQKTMNNNHFNLKTYLVLLHLG